MIILLVALSVVNLQILTATEPDSPAAVPGLQRALLWISVIGGDEKLRKSSFTV